MAFGISTFFPNPEFNTPLPFRKNNLLKFFLAIFAFFWVFTGLTATNPGNWMLENSLTIPAVILVVFLYRKLPLSNFTYTLVLVYLLLHLYGSQNAYAENPFGFWLQKQVNFSRNNYDRIVHFSFGFLLAYPIQEVLFKAFKALNWRLYLLPVEISLSVSAFYEIVEWLVAGVFFPQAGMAFLGAQGDIWDPQKDMFLATVGAILTMLLVLIYRNSKNGRLMQQKSL